VASPRSWVRGRKPARAAGCATVSIISDLREQFSYRRWREPIGPPFANGQRTLGEQLRTEERS
jgi:hypothetical protein